MPPQLPDDLLLGSLLPQEFWVILLPNNFCPCPFPGNTCTAIDPRLLVDVAELYTFFCPLIQGLAR